MRVLSLAYARALNTKGNAPTHSARAITFLKAVGKMLITALQLVLSLPSAAQSHLQDSSVAEHNDTAVGARLNVIIGIAFAVKISSYFVAGNTKFGCDGVHTAMRKAVFYCTKAIECCTHNV